MTSVASDRLHRPAREAPLRRVAIVTGHFPPSNLVGVHRSRFLAQYLPEFGWEPVIVTVDHRHYEEQLDWNLHRMLRPGIRVESVGAMEIGPLRLMGDIALRGFVPLLRRILRLVDRQEIDFLYITIPSFYAAPLGRLVHALRGIPYGIDYQDPWVHAWPGSDRRWSRGWMSSKIANFLEPVAVRDAALITGVTEAYYAGALERNPHLVGQAVTAAAPIGTDARDHACVRELGIQPYLFQREPGVFRLVYAGALLPQAVAPLERLFAAIAAARAAFADVRLHFIGTGTSPNDPAGYTVRPLAARHGLWGTLVHEHPARIPYLDVLAHLEAADGIFVLGSTEPHYTPSKVYQALLAEKPILAVLHQASSACAVLRQTGAGRVLAFDGAAGLDALTARFPAVYRDYRRFAATFDPAAVDRTQMEQYSARSVTRQLAGALDEVMARRRAR